MAVNRFREDAGMMDAYMREALTSQMNAVREVLKHNAAASPPKSPPPDAIDLVCVNGVWQAPLGLRGAR
jgi:hypothetical protein